MLLIATVVVAQGVGLAWTAAAGAGAIALAVGAAALCAFAWDRRARVPHLDFVISAVVFGGFGMVAAAAIGSGEHAGMVHGNAPPHVRLAAIAGMLAACVPVCLWKCAPLCGGGVVRQALAHLAVTAGMVAGMVAAGAAAGPWLAPLLGPAAGMHLAMVLGMAAGSAVSLAAAVLLNPASRHPQPRPRKAAWPA